MNAKSFALASAVLFAAFAAAAHGQLDKDVVTTSEGDLHIGFLGHGSLMFTFNDIVVYVDPLSGMADYAAHQADLVLITHEHGDHLDPKAIALLRKDGTVVIAPEKCASAVGACVVMRNGDTQTAAGLKIEAVPAYNIVHLRGNGQPYHPKGVGNGYVVTFGDKRVYIAADTENIPEMKALKDIAVAFLPMNLPYTMSPEMVADAARAFRPGILYPYHYGETDTSRLVELLKDEKDIDVRIKRIYPPPAKKK
ncbi:MAG: MBL fold metallo-hydrolase [Candidatus Aminicenantes bacterium]|nr:MBL fold metallo-hydrolase [Candidatus Aminicenantes bacterium]